MIVLKQGDIEAFRFNSREPIKLKKGQIAGYRIPSKRALFISRYTTLAIIILSLACFAKVPGHLYLLQVLWVIQAVHLMVKVAFWWRPVRMDESKAIETCIPGMSLQIEHYGYLTSVSFLSVLSLNATSGPGWIWIALILMSNVMLVYSGVLWSRFSSKHL